MTFTREILAEFLNEIIGSKEFIYINSKKIRQWILELDPNGELFHLKDGDILYTKGAWSFSEEKQKTLRAQSVVENLAIEEKKLIYTKLKEAIRVKLGGIASDKFLSELAQRAFANKNPVAFCKAMGLDIDNIPNLNKPHLIMTEKKGDYIKI